MKLLSLLSQNDLIYYLLQPMQFVILSPSTATFKMVSPLTVQLKMLHPQTNASQQIIAFDQYSLRLLFLTNIFAPLLTSTVYDIISLSRTLPPIKVEIKIL